MVEKVRTLGFPTAFAIGLGTMIAAGIFSLSGTAVAEVGSSAVVAFVIAAGVASLTAAAYSEFASIYGESGGGYLFTSRTLEHDTVVYLEGVMLFLGYSATTAFYLATMGEWVHEFVLPGVPKWSSGVVVALALGWLNARGTEESGAFQIIVTGAKVAVLLAFVGGFVLYQPVGQSVGHFADRFTSDGVGILQIAALAFITFFGFSAVAASAGEIRDPTRTVPRAIAASIVTVTVLYTLVIVAMVNSPVPAEVVAAQGETAMGSVAEAFMGPLGMQLIVAGAIFSMVSASNASILAASRIGYLMGREGRAFRRFHEIHRTYGTPVWGVAACTFTIVSLIVVFTGVFPSHGDAFLGLHLGLDALTGFANLNLLVPLSVVNLALILHRRNHPDLERPFRVPLAPVTPALGILANLALVASLPLDGVVAGVVGIGVFLVIYLWWGGSLSVDEIMRSVSTPDEEADAVQGVGGERDDTVPFRVLVPVAREEDVGGLVRFANDVGHAIHDEVEVRVVHITRVPEQTPSDAVGTEGTDVVVETLRERVKDLEVAAEVRVEGYVSRDVAFTILERARELPADLILMGYPKRHRHVVEAVEHRTPCDVIYAYGLDLFDDLDVINIGAGGGPNHMALLPLVDALGEQGSEVHVIRVNPEFSGTPEDVVTTVERLPHAREIDIHNVEADSVSEGLVRAARRHGGSLWIGASRDHLFKQWLYGSTPDSTVQLAEAQEVPVIIYRSGATIRGRFQEAMFVLYQLMRSILGRS